MPCQAGITSRLFTHVIAYWDICKSGEARKTSWLGFAGLNVGKLLAVCLCSDLVFEIPNKQNGMDLEASRERLSTDPTRQLTKQKVSWWQCSIIVATEDSSLNDPCRMAASPEDCLLTRTPPAACFLCPSKFSIPQAEFYFSLCVQHVCVCSNVCESQSFVLRLPPLVFILL